VFSINLNSLAAGIDIRIYIILFAILLLLFVVCYLNERLEYCGSRNNTWHLLMSFFPCNGVLWPNQVGITRKLLQATIGFGILILSSLYQAKLSEQLMIPYPPPVVTLRDIESYVSSGNSKLLFNFENGPTMQYV